MYRIDFNHFIIVISILFLLLSIACSDESGSKSFAISNNKITIDNTFPEVDDVVTISFKNMGHIQEDSALRAEIIVINSGYSLIHYQVPLTRNYDKKTDNINYDCKFQIPENSLVLNVYDSYSYGNEPERYLHLPIYMDKVPLEHSLPLIFHLVDSFEKLKDLFNADEHYYENDYLRWGFYWEVLASQGLIDESTQREIDSLVNILDQNNKFNNNKKLIGYSTLAYAYYRLGLKENSEKLIDKCIEINSKNKFDIDEMVFYNLIGIYSQFGDRNRIGYLDCDNSDCRDMILKLIKIISSSKNILYYRNIFQIADSVFINKHIDIFKELFDKLLVITDASDKKQILYSLSSSPDLIYVISMRLMEVNRINDAIAMLKTGIELMSKSNSDFYSKRNIVHPTTRNGILISMKRQLGNAYLTLNDTVNAAMIFKDILLREEMNDFNIGALSLTSNSLSSIYIENWEIDSVLKYLKLSFELKSPFAPELLTKFKEKLQSNGYNASSIKTIENRLRGNYYQGKELIRSLKIQTDKRVVDITNLKDTLLTIFMYDDDCPVCNIASVNLHEEISKLTSVPHIEIFLSKKNNKRKLHEAYGNKIMITQDKDFLKKRFPNLQFPYAIILRENYILYQSKDIPNNLDYLRKLFAIY